MERRFASLAVVAFLGLAAASCQRSSRGLSVSTRTATDAPAATPTSNVTGISLDLGNGIVIERIRLVVREVEVEGGDAGAACPGDEGMPDGGGTVTPMDAGHDGGDAEGADGDDCDHGLEFGPFLVDVAATELTGPVSFAFDVPVPPGTYDEVEIKVNTLPAGKALADAGLAEMAGLHASVAVDGRIDGETFHYATPMEIEQEKEGRFVIGEATAPNLTLDFDPSGWFGGAGTARLDPREPTNDGAIRANIRKSIRLERDDDHDGHEDGEEHDGGGDGHGGGDDHP